MVHRIGGCRRDLNQIPEQNQNRVRFRVGVPELLGWPPHTPNLITRAERKRL